MADLGTMLELHMQKVIGFTAIGLAGAIILERLDTYYHALRSRDYSSKYQEKPDQSENNL